MVHIDISAETKSTLNKIRGLIQAQEANLLTYDKTVNALCLYYLKTKGVNNENKK